MDRRIWLAIIIGILLRTVLINSPMVDAFGSMRQTYTAGYTAYLIENGVNVSELWHAQSIVRNHVPLEVPLYNLLTVGLIRIFGEHDYAYRLTSLIYWILGAIYFAYLLRRIYGEREARYVMWVYVLLPLSIFIGHYYHPEVLAIQLSFIVVFHFYFFLEKQKPLDLVISLVSLALILFVRATYFHIYFILIILAFSKYGWRTFLKPWAYLYILPLIPFAWWTLSLGDLASSNRMTQFLGVSEIRLSPRFWGMMIFHRLGGLTLSPIGFPLFILGVASAKTRTNRSIEFAWLYAVIAYVLIVARGNYVHPHYQAALLIPFSIFIGRFLFQVAENKIGDSWYEWWRAVPKGVKVAALSIYIFFDALVIILFFNCSWDINNLLALLGNLNITLLVIIFILSQIVLFPFIMWVWSKKEKLDNASLNRISIILLLLIFISGMVVIEPMYRPDTDFLNAAKSVSDNLGKDAGIVFVGQKDDSNPFMFYSVQRNGWTYNLTAFHSKGWEALKKYKNDGAEYLAVMKGNRYLASENKMSKEINSYLEQLDVYYEDTYIRIYILDNLP